MNFQQKIKTLRKARKKTQEETALLLGVSRATYASYEAGRRKPDINDVVMLAEYFGVTTDYLLGHTPDQQAYDNTALHQFMDNEKDVVRFIDDNRISFDGTIYDLPEKKTALIKNAVKTAMLLAMQEVKQSDKQPTAGSKNKQTRKKPD